MFSIIYLFVCLHPVEHIIPQSSKFDYIHKLGNLTLLEGPNSKNGHKGNSSISNKNYEFKKNSYTESGAKITRKIVKDYPTFDEESVKIRTTILAENLIKFKNVYENWILQNGYDLDLIKQITGLIYLNMSPLHDGKFGKMLWFKSIEMLENE